MLSPFISFSIRYQSIVGQNFVVHEVINPLFALVTQVIDIMFSVTPFPVFVLHLF